MTTASGKIENSGNRRLNNALKADSLKHELEVSKLQSRISQKIEERVTAAA